MEILLLDLYFKAPSKKEVKNGKFEQLQMKEIAIIYVTSLN